MRMEAILAANKIDGIIMLGAVDVKAIAIAAAVVGGIGLFLGLFLGLAGKWFAVEVDEKESEIRELLPGINCGACGYAGCDACAKAIVTGEAPVDACPVADQEANAAIAQAMGQQPVQPAAGKKKRKVAYVNCAGSCDKVKVTYEYNGVMDCNKAAEVSGNAGKACSYGCMGLGSCVEACAFDAIHIVDSIAVVDPEKCTGCTKCVPQCPNNLIKMVPGEARTFVTCSSKDPGKVVRTLCTIGCIGCKLCVKQCEFDAIHVEDNLASIDYEKCTNCGKCVVVCPVKVIYQQEIAG